MNPTASAGPLAPSRCCNVAELNSRAATINNKKGGRSPRLLQFSDHVVQLVEVGGWIQPLHPVRGFKLAKLITETTGPVLVTEVTILPRVAVKRLIVLDPERDVPSFVIGPAIVVGCDCHGSLSVLGGLVGPFPAPW